MRYSEEVEVGVLESEIRESGVRETVNYFGLIKQKLSTVGNNDSEYHQLDDILEAYKKGYITAEVARNKADLIFESKIQR